MSGRDGIPMRFPSGHNKTENITQISEPVIEITPGASANLSRCIACNSDDGENKKENTTDHEKRTRTRTRAP
ncbi:uncharacterized protein Bfra_005132 [Botrytis fragariae]|uniref:Uncharacterized protein n=1 Tax=Botrytis fragariae TaxID=1964551 RepID=A0A8H6ATU7_9HELO|nr:uncharacterized protein Bfra_005132 [Botrytis fragariae]KAF5873668.1 hypothetical protein Bfra_005132 [Botrytis fragariae]